VKRALVLFAIVAWTIMLVSLSELVVNAILVRLL